MHVFEITTTRRVEIVETNPAQQTSAQRAAFTSVNPHLRTLHRDAQCAMFGACRAAGLDSTDRQGMLLAINATLGTRFHSRTQMTPVEQATFTRVIELGLWASGWRMRLA